MYKTLDYYVKMAFFKDYYNKNVSDLVHLLLITIIKIAAEEIVISDQ